MADDKKKSEKRESNSLAERLKKIQADSATRRANAYAERKVSRDKRREAMNSKGRQSGGSLQGLNVSFGVKIVN